MVLSIIQKLLTPSEKTIPLLSENQIQKLKESILKSENNNSPLALFPEERIIVQHIKAETARKNANNITRTKAYLDFYKEIPEIEWSFLAHMVSRNAGYHMTDLKGEILPALLEDKETRIFYLFLKRANAFIFQDAYPQLLLYKKSMEAQRPLFHLLPAFEVTKAMTVFWERFWKEGSKAEITLALIINEQSMLQDRLISKIKAGHLYEKLLFLLQDRLELTTVLFPYKKSGGSKRPYSLAGTSISHFESPEKRIAIGKKLYSILFMNKVVNQSAYKFALSTPHTGSRSDYWPKSYSTRKRDRKKLYSPPLLESWELINHSFLKTDWVSLKTLHHLDALHTLPLTRNFDVTNQGKLLVKLASEIKVLAT